MEITNARYLGKELLLETVDRRNVIRFMEGFKAGEYEIRRVKKKRSLDANAYCWALCGRIADRVGASKEDVYRRNIREGNEYFTVPLAPEAVDEFMAVWSGKGLGWFCDVAEATEKWVWVLAYCGSSTYDARAMAQLIERIIQDAKEVDVETLTPFELSRLLEDWDVKAKKRDKHPAGS